jgi:hypothetical protein
MPKPPTEKTTTMMALRRNAPVQPPTNLREDGTEMGRGGVRWGGGS